MREGVLSHVGQGIWTFGGRCDGFVIQHSGSLLAYTVGTRHASNRWGGGMAWMRHSWSMRLLVMRSISISISTRWACKRRDLLLMISPALTWWRKHGEIIFPTLVHNYVYNTVKIWAFWFSVESDDWLVWLSIIAHFAQFLWVLGMRFPLSMTLDFLLHIEYLMNAFMYGNWTLQYTYLLVWWCQDFRYINCRSFYCITDTRDNESESENDSESESKKRTKKPYHLLLKKTEDFNTTLVRKRGVIFLARVLFGIVTRIYLEPEDKAAKIHDNEPLDPKVVERDRIRGGKGRQEGGIFSE